MSKFYRFAVLAAALLASFASHAAGAADIEISGAWTRATVPGQQAASVDMTITSRQAAALTGVSSPAAKTGTLHSMKTENGMMKMREAHAIELPAGKPVNLKASGYHLMLDELKAPLKEGETVPLTLSFKVGKHGAVKVETKVEVRSLTATQEEHQHNH